MQRIEVAVGIVVNSQGLVLVGQRTVEDAYYLKWEFPGGKLESGETPEHALKRELSEELGIDVQKSEHLMILNHDYPDRNVRLYVQKVVSYQGQPQSAEGQALQWLRPDQLSELDFLAGNQAIIQRLLSE